MSRCVRTFTVFLALVTLGFAANADTKAEMVSVIDKVAMSKPEAESLIDWENLVVKSPQLAGQDLQKLYGSMDAANKKAFRKSFLKSFASSFQQAAHGHRMVDVMNKKGAMSVGGSAEHPMMVLHPTGAKAPITIGYVRKHGKLLLQSIEPGK